MVAYGLFVFADGKLYTEKISRKSKIQEIKNNPNWAGSGAKHAFIILYINIYI